MLVKPNWDNFTAKFSENPQYNFEWFCYLLFSKEYNKLHGIHRYKNQSGIETDPIEIDNEVIGWQSKFYLVPKVETLNKDLKETLRKAKRDYPNITKIVFYTNMEWTKYHKDKNTKAEKTIAQKEIEELFSKEKIELVLRMDSYFISDFVSIQQREISRYFFELDSKWELTNNGFRDTLRYCYLKNFKTISLLDEKRKRVSDIFVNLAIIKEQKEEKNTEKLINREAFLSSYEEIHKPKEPIAIKELINKSNKSLIYGKAGIGKTTLCKYIAYMWAKGELYNEFEYVVYIPLRKWDSTQLKEVIRSQYYTQYKEEINLDIKENSNKILFLFDGYDELKSDKRDGLHKAIRDNDLTHYIITTRPYGYQKSNFRVDEYFETVGFTDENVTEYIDNFFDYEMQKAERLKSYLHRNISIKHIGYIPLMLEMICSLWEQKEFGADIIMTELYTQVIEDFLEKHSQDERVYEWENREDIKELLGKIAFEGLTKQTILFDGKLIRDTIGKENLDFFKESIVNSGFLKSDRKDKSLLGNNFEFPHLTFQEYFSALYVSTLSKEEQSDIIRDWKFYPHMQMFFAFLGGLIDNQEFLINEIEKEPVDILDFYNTLFLMIIFSQVKKDNVDKKYIEEFNNRLNSWLRFFIDNRKYDYELFLDRLQSINGLLNDEIIDSFIDFINYEDVNVYCTRFAEESLARLGRTDKKIVDVLIEIIKDDYNRDDFNRIITVIELLVGLGRNDEKIVDLLLTCINNEEINSDTRRIITKSLIGLGRTDDKIVNILQSSIYNKNMNCSDKRSIIEFLIKIEKVDNKTLSTLECIKKDIDIEKKLLKITDSNNIINLIKDKNSDPYLIKKLMSFLEKEERINDELLDVFIVLIKDKSLNLLLKVSIVKSLLKLKRIDDKFIKVLIDLIKNKNLDSYIRREIGEYLVKVDRANNVINENTDICQIVDIVRYLVEYRGKISDKLLIVLINIIKNDSINSYLKTEVAIYLGYIKNDSDKFIEIIIDFIKDEDINEHYKAIVSRCLSGIRRVDDKYIDIIIKLLQDKNLDLDIRENIIKSLVELDRDDKEIEDILIDFIKNKDNYIVSKEEVIISCIRKIIKQPDILKKININNYFTETFEINIATKIFFDAYNNNYNVQIDNVVSNLLYNKLPLYIREERYYTHVDNEEIELKIREEDKEIYNEIKMLLRRDDLDTYL